MNNVPNLPDLNSRDPIKYLKSLHGSQIKMKKGGLVNDFYFFIQRRPGITVNGKGSGANDHESYFMIF